MNLKVKKNVMTANVEKCFINYYYIYYMMSEFNQIVVYDKIFFNNQNFIDENTVKDFYSINNFQRDDVNGRTILTDDILQVNTDIECSNTVKSNKARLLSVIYDNDLDEVGEPSVQVSAFTEIKKDELSTAYNFSQLVTEELIDMVHKKLRPSEVIIKSLNPLLTQNNLKYYGLEFTKEQTYVGDFLFNGPDFELTQGISIKGDLKLENSTKRKVHAGRLQITNTILNNNNTTRSDIDNSIVENSYTGFQIYNINETTWLQGIGPSSILKITSANSSNASLNFIEVNGNTLQTIFGENCSFSKNLTVTGSSILNALTINGLITQTPISGSTAANIMRKVVSNINSGVTSTNTNPSFESIDTFVSKGFHVIPNCGPGTINPIVVSGDTLIGSRGLQNNQAFSIATWSNIHLGIRLLSTSSTQGSIVCRVANSILSISETGLSITGVLSLTGPPSSRKIDVVNTLIFRDSVDNNTLFFDAAMSEMKYSLSNTNYSHSFYIQEVGKMTISNTEINTTNNFVLRNISNLTTRSIFSIDSNGKMNISSTNSTSLNSSISLNTKNSAGTTKEVMLINNNSCIINSPINTSLSSNPTSFNDVGYIFTYENNLNYFSSNSIINISSISLPYRGSYIISVISIIKNLGTIFSCSTCDIGIGDNNNTIDYPHIQNKNNSYADNEEKTFFFSFAYLNTSQSEKILYLNKKIDFSSGEINMFYKYNVIKVS